MLTIAQHTSLIQRTFQTFASIEDNIQVGVSVCKPAFNPALLPSYARVWMRMIFSLMQKR